MKRIVFCFDGSWNRLNAGCPTNVVLIAESVRPTAKDGTTQIVYYDEGVGTASDEKIRGGAFGKGLLTNIREAYRFLIFNYEPDDEIFAFGFSRGAFTARSFVGFVRHAGILNINDARRIDDAIKLYRSALTTDGDDHIEALKFRAEFSSRICISEADENWRCERWPGYTKGDAQILEIKYLGVWDTVAALGLPRFIPGSAQLNRKHAFHDVKLTSKVQAARHAVAIDEKRVLFLPTLWSNVADLNVRKGFSHFDMDAPYQQRWFPGVHGSVGGGGPERGLSDGALAWIINGAKKAGLDLSTENSSRIYEIKPNFRASLDNDPENKSWHDKYLGWLKKVLLTADRPGPNDINEVSAAARRRWRAGPDELWEKTAYRPKTLSLVADQMGVAAILPGKDEIEYKGYLAQHIVEPNDNISKLAGRYYGDKMLYGKIFDANRDIIDDPDEIYVGMVLKIPII